MFFPSVWVRGYAPETPLFLFTKTYLSFFIQKIGLFIDGKEYFYTTFCFFITFLRPLHIRAKVSKCFSSF
ncbi:hypothetical protein BREVNS_1195 [Brevinematales bacterium NS]|nr:hypothetical protein BREVNS_1195 [Brevinematales bacterium NS]